VIVTPNDLFSLDQAGGITPISGGKSDTYVGVNNAVAMPEREVMLVGGRDMLHLIKGKVSSKSKCEGSQDTSEP
jgi:hypothetical protein